MLSNNKMGLTFLEGETAQLNFVYIFFCSRVDQINFA